MPRAQRLLFDDLEVDPPAQAPEPEPLPAVSPPSSTASPSSSVILSPSSSPYQPINLFDFDWRDFPNPPVPPTERREKFCDANCGPTAPFLSPYDAFIAIWSQDFMEYIANETNRYAQQVAEKQYHEGTLAPESRISSWHDTNADELYVYFGLLLATGLCVKGDLKEYWCKDELMATPNIGKYMSINRFTLLSRCLHFADNTTDIQTLTRSQAKIFKIAPIVNELNSKFQALYNPNRNIAIDESLTQWKGWLDIKQFIKNKAASVGIKTFEVCESQTGYLWRFKVHAGREETTETEITPVSGVIATLVLELLKGLENKGHTVWMDNFYNSPALARVLKSLGFDCVGTLRTNRQCVPQQIATLKKSEMTIGQISGRTSGDVDVMVWRDHNRVALISTYHGVAVHTAGGKTKPIAIHDYNVCMGGVDKKDQMLSAYPIERKRTQVWYKKLFRRLLNVSVLNAFILYKKSTALQQIAKHREFRKNLINALLARHNVRPLTTPRMASNLLGRVDAPIFTQEVLQHFPIEYGLINPNKKERIRRSCVLCHKRVQTYCPACNVALCPIKCIKKYHEGK